jgi:hypothetical protein
VLLVGGDSGDSVEESAHLMPCSAAVPSGPLSSLQLAAVWVVPVAIFVKINCCWFLFRLSVFGCFGFCALGLSPT